MIRPATVEDLQPIRSLEDDLFGTEAWDDSQVRAELTGAGRVVRVSDDGEVSGYAVVLVSGDVADLLRVAVRPDRQRAGLATALVGAAMLEAKRAGARQLLLEVADGNRAARALYAAVGFLEIDRRPKYYRDGDDALVLALEL